MDREAKTVSVGCKLFSTLCSWRQAKKSHHPPPGSLSFSQSVLHSYFPRRISTSLIDPQEVFEDDQLFYRILERSQRLKDYISFQTQINPDLRGATVASVVHAHNMLGLLPQTLYRAVYILDRYLSIQIVSAKKLPLVGMIAMLIAAKLEEVVPPAMVMFISKWNWAYTREEMLNMEVKMVKNLQWKVALVTPYHFLERIILAADGDALTGHLIIFFAELALTNSTVLLLMPSHIAAASAYAARCTLGKMPTWSQALRRETGLCEWQIIDCAKVMICLHSLVRQRKKYAPLYEKFASAERCSVALLPPSLEISRK